MKRRIPAWVFVAALPFWTAVWWLNSAATFRLGDSGRHRTTRWEPARALPAVPGDCRRRMLLHRQSLPDCRWEPRSGVRGPGDFFIRPDHQSIGVVRGAPRVEIENGT
jgi:hypothetical protein